VINLFRERVIGARQFERLLSKQSDEDQIFGRIDLQSLVRGAWLRIFSVGTTVSSVAGGTG
jgi:hypothetical protein